MVYENEWIFFLTFIEQIQDITWLISGRKHKQKTRKQNTKTLNTIIVQVTSRIYPENIQNFILFHTTKSTILKWVIIQSNNFFY
jgi:hypothetical protein